MQSTFAIRSTCFDHYDDLSKHAAAYRQYHYYYEDLWTWSFSGDVSYAHSRLLERACKLNQHLEKVFDSLTYVETQAVIFLDIFLQT